MNKFIQEDKMDRKEFFIKLAKIAGVSVTSITLTKQQIASISTGLSSILFSSCGTKNPVAPQSSYPKPDCKIFTCQLPAGNSCDDKTGDGNYTCTQQYRCVIKFNCNPSGKF